MILQRRRVTIGLLVGLALAVLVKPLVGSVSAQTLATGTAYDKLDLASPEAALRTFLTAYRQGDFVTAFWVLSPQAQREWKKHLDLFMFDRPCLVRSATSVMGPLIEVLVPPMDKWEQPEDVSFLFAHLMTVAQQRSWLPLDLDGLPADLSASKVPAPGARRDTRDGHVDIAVPLRAYPAPVIFRLETSPLSKWRVRQAIVPGTDDNAIPWGRC